MKLFTRVKLFTRWWNTKVVPEGALLHAPQANAPPPVNAPPPANAPPPPPAKQVHYAGPLLSASGEPIEQHLGIRPEAALLHIALTDVPSTVERTRAYRCLVADGLERVLLSLLKAHHTTAASPLALVAGNPDLRLALDLFGPRILLGHGVQEAALHRVWESLQPLLPAHVVGLIVTRDQAHLQLAVSLSPPPPTDPSSQT